MGIINEFKEFAVKGNMVDMAVGIIMGGAFGTIVKSLVDDVVMPPIGLLMGGVDFSNLSYTLKAAEGEAEAVAINYGLFINAIIAFLIVAFCLFLIIKSMNTVKKRMEEEEAAAPAEPSEDVLLLREIRDSLKAQSN